MPHAIAAVNLTWALLVVVLSGLSATWCLRMLGVSRASAFVAGTLFAFSPYALYRQVDHFSLVIYLVPFACAAALRLANGEPHQRWGRRRMRDRVRGTRAARFELRLLRIFRIVLHRSRYAHRLRRAKETGACSSPARCASLSSPAAHSSISLPASIRGT